MSDTRKVADLFGEIYGYLGTYVWRGAEYRGGVWYDTPAPKGGETATLGTFGMVGTRATVGREDDVTFLAIPRTRWSELSGGTVERSNCRSILRDYQDHVIHVTGDRSTEELMFPVDAEIPVDLFNAIVALNDYPLYDEGDLSELESEIEFDNWESWGRSNFVSDVRDLAGDDVPEFDNHEYVDRLFDDLREQGLATWESESADSGFWADMAEAVDAAWKITLSRR